MASLVSNPFIAGHSFLPVVTGHAPAWNKVLPLVAQHPYRPTTVVTTVVTIAPWDVLPNHGATSLLPMREPAMMSMSWRLRMHEGTMSRIPP